MFCFICFYNQHENILQSPASASVVVPAPGSLPGAQSSEQGWGEPSIGRALMRRSHIWLKMILKHIYEPAELGCCLPWCFPATFAPWALLAGKSAWTVQRCALSAADA